MSQPNLCRTCNCELGKNTLVDLCPRCLLTLGVTSLLDEDAEKNKLAETAAQTQPDRKYAAPEPGELQGIIPQIEFLELIGAGGMGAVYKARQRSLDRLVAVKILRPDLVSDRSFADRFLREGRTLGRLNHPNIVSVYDVGQSGDYFYILMEYVDGTNLRQLIQNRLLPPQEALAIIPQVCDALQSAHNQGVVHRDIKPENILLDKEGRVKIADFGLAKAMGASGNGESLTQTDQVMGTLKYMAPEQMTGSKGIDHRADIYSLGVVFYEMLTGEIPLGRFEPPSKRARLDIRLDEIVLRALEKEPNKRYQHASEVKSNIQNVAKEPEPSPSPTASPSAPAPETPAQATAVPQSWFDRIRSRILLSVSGFDELESPYFRWVVLPPIASAGFIASIYFLNHYNYRGPLPPFFDRFVFWPLGFFFTLNVFWFCWNYLIRPFFGRGTNQQPPETLAQKLEKQGDRLKIIGILGILSFFSAASEIATPLSTILAVFLSIITWLAGRSLKKLKHPGILRLLAPMIPITPVVILGLPIALSTLRLLAKPEAKEILEKSDPIL